MPFSEHAPNFLRLLVAQVVTDHPFVLCIQLRVRARDIRIVSQVNPPPVQVPTGPLPHPRSIELLEGARRTVKQSQRLTFGLHHVVRDHTAGGANRRSLPTTLRERVELPQQRIVVPTPRRALDVAVEHRGQVLDDREVRARALETELVHEGLGNPVPLDLPTHHETGLGTLLGPPASDDLDHGRRVDVHLLRERVHVVQLLPAVRTPEELLGLLLRDADLPVPKVPHELDRVVQVRIARVLLGREHLPTVDLREELSEPRVEPSDILTAPDRLPGLVPEDLLVEHPRDVPGDVRLLVDQPRLDRVVEPLVQDPADLDGLRQGRALDATALPGLQRMHEAEGRTLALRGRRGGEHAPAASEALERVVDLRHLAVVVQRLLAADRRDHVLPHGRASRVEELVLLVEHRVQVLGEEFHPPPVRLGHEVAHEGRPRAEVTGGSGGCALRVDESPEVRRGHAALRETAQASADPCTDQRAPGVAIVVVRRGSTTDDAADHGAGVLRGELASDAPQDAAHDRALHALGEPAVQSPEARRGHGWRHREPGSHVGRLCEVPDGRADLARPPPELGELQLRTGDRVLRALGPPRHVVEKAPRHPVGLTVDRPGTAARSDQRPEEGPLGGSTSIPGRGVPGRRTGRRETEQTRATEQLRGCR